MIYIMFPVSESAWEFTRADGPCWRGHLQLWKFVIGWHREVRSARKEGK